MGNDRTFVSRLLLAAGALTALAALAGPVLNPDLWWHLSAGKYIFSNHSLPAADFLSWSEAGAAWLDFEWLAQVVYYTAWSLGGSGAFFALKFLLLGATLPALYAHLRRAGQAAQAFWALPLWGLALLPNADLRPENFSALFFALLLLRLEEARRGPGWGATPAALAGTAGLFALWANLHAGFAYGLLLLAAYPAGGYLSGRAWPSPDGPGGRVSPLLAAAAFAGTLLNPWGPKLYSVLYAHAAEAAPLAGYLAEWAPPSLSNPFHWPFMALLLSSFALLLLRFWRERRLPLAQLLVLGVFAFEAARHSRHMVFFCLPAALYSAEAAARLRPRDELRRAGLAALAACAVYLAAFALPRFAAVRVNLGEEAAGAAAYLKANAAGLSGRRLYNPWTWGGYLGWALHPDYKVFLDGRYLFHGYLGPVSAAMESAEAWEKFAAERGITLALFRRDRALLPEERVYGRERLAVPRPAYLSYMPEEKWALVYWDAFSVLFARRAGAPPPPEFRIVRADDLERARLDLCAGALKKREAEEELARYYAAAAGARSTGEADRFRAWLGGFPAGCRR